MNERNKCLVINIAQEFISADSDIQTAYDRNSVSSVWDRTIGKLFMKRLRPETLGRIISAGVRTPVMEFLLERPSKNIGTELLHWHACSVIVCEIWSLLTAKENQQ